jgi:hypothetical protein
MDKYRSGVLILGSLFWDNSNGRKAWREHYFGENFYSRVIDVNVPTRYGRYSQGRQCPTMVLSSDFLENQKFGTAKFIPFKNPKMGFQEVICSARDLSEAEGSTSRDFIKGGNTKWCIITCLLNNNLSNEAKENFLNNWVSNYNVQLTDELIRNFKMDSEVLNIIDVKGCLQIDWPDSLSNYDFVLATQTKPRRALGDSSGYLHTTDLASQIFERPEYFVKNKLNGIFTPEDFEIIQLLENKSQVDFRKRAINDGCIEIEIDNFIQTYFS